MDRDLIHAKLADDGDRCLPLFNGKALLVEHLHLFIPWAVQRAECVVAHLTLPPPADYFKVALDAHVPRAYPGALCDCPVLALRPAAPMEHVVTTALAA